MNTPMDKLLDAVAWTPISVDVLAYHEMPYAGLHATHEGELTIGGYTFRCYRLSDGSRVLDAEDVEELLGDRE